MKILAVGDVHWSEYSSIIRRRGEKYSKRLENLINSLNWLEELAEQRHVDKIVFLGDFFDSSRVSAVEITALQEVVWSNIEHVFIVGNHEIQMDDTQISTAHLLNLVPNARVIDSPDMDTGFGYHLLYLPYVKEDKRQTVKSIFNYLTSGYFFTQEVKKVIAFSHNDLKIQYGMIPTTIGYEVSDIESTCNLFINGHLHNGSKIGSCIYNVGNLTGQNFGEDATEYSHNVLLFDTDYDKGGEFELIENPYAFNFYKYDYVSCVEDIENIVNYKIKDNAILTVKSIESASSDIRMYLNTVVDSGGKVKEFRVVSIPDKSDVNECDVETIEPVNHLEEFVSFVKSNLTMTPNVVEELSIICK